MAGGEDRVAFQHSRACVSHDLRYLLTHFGFVAVDAAFRAGGFIVAEFAGEKPFLSVFEQLSAFRAQIFSVCSMQGVTIYPYHGSYCLFFFFELCCH